MTNSEYSEKFKTQVALEKKRQGEHNIPLLEQFEQDFSEQLRAELERVVIKEEAEDSQDSNNRLFRLKDYDHLLLCPETNCDGFWHRSELPTSESLASTQEEREKLLKKKLGNQSVQEALLNETHTYEQIIDIEQEIANQTKSNHHQIVCNSCGKGLEIPIDSLQKDKYFIETCKCAIRGLVYSALDGTGLEKKQEFVIESEDHDIHGKKLQFGYVINPQRTSSSDQEIIQNYLRLAVLESEYIGNSRPEFEIKPSGQKIRISATKPEGKVHFARKMRL